MKKLTLDNVKDILSTKIINLTERYNYQYYNVGRNNSIFILKEDFEKELPFFPSEKMTATTITQYNRQSSVGYFFPIAMPSYRLLFGKNRKIYPQGVLDSIVEKTVAWTNNEKKESDILVKNRSVYRSYSEEEEKANQAKEQKIFNELVDIYTIMYCELYPRDILEEKFWADIDYQLPSSNINTAANVLASLFENEQDIIDFQEKILKTVSTSHLEYLVFSKAVKSFPDESFKSTTYPNVLATALRSNNESLKKEAVRLFKKYSFDVYKDLLIEEHASSNKKAFVNYVEAFLKEKNAFKAMTLDQVFITNEKNTIYENIIKINFAVLKNQVGNDFQLTETLIALAVSHAKDNYREISYEFADKQKHVVIKVNSYNKEDIDNFKADFTQVLEFAFSDVYLGGSFEENKTNKEQLSFHYRGSRLQHEANENVKKAFKDGLNKWKFKEKLEEDLNEPAPVVRRKKL